MIHIEKEPFWVQEAFIALSREQDEDYRSIMSHPDKFGMTREETQEMFAPYLAYRDAVLPELMALLIQAGKLRRYVGSEGDKDRFRILEMTGTVLLNENDTEKLTCWKKLKKAEKERRMGSLLRLALGKEEADMENCFDPETVRVRSVEEVMELLDSFDAPAELKYALLQMYLNQDKYMEELESLADRMVLVLKKHFPILRETYEARQAEMDMEDCKRFLSQGQTGLQLDVGQQECSVYLSVFRYNGISISSQTEECKMTLLMGMFLNRLISGKSQKKELSQAEFTGACKALSDSNRYRILQLILERGKMYPQELAGEIGVTSATISHHLAAMMEAELLQIVVGENEKRIYYAARKDRLRDMGKAWLEMAEREEV